MVGENFKIYMPEMAKTDLNCTMVNFFLIYMLQMAKIDFKLSTMVGNVFQIYIHQMAKIEKV